MESKPLYILGDTHGGWIKLFSLLEKFDIKDCFLIHVGDVGIGFKPPRMERKQFISLNDNFKARNIQFLAIRGNHDDPSYFLGGVKFSNFELLEDYTYLNINGENILLVGGAVSIDRRVRVPHISWWEGEEFVLKPELVKKCDVLITHTPPSWNGPFDKDGIANWCDRDPSLWEECKKERLEVSELVKLCGAGKHYCGHFHQFFQVDHGGCLSRILDEYEIVEHKS